MRSLRFILGVWRYLDGEPGRAWAKFESTGKIEFARNVRNLAADVGRLATAYRRCVTQRSLARPGAAPLIGAPRYLRPR